VARIVSTSSAAVLLMVGLSGRGIIAVVNVNGTYCLSDA
jgi:hypothetical protein